MGLFSFVGDILGDLTGATKAGKAAQKAGEIQAAEAAKGVEEQRRQFDLTRQDNLPFLNAGQQALGGQLNLLGLNGSGAEQDAINAILASPMYQSLVGQGEEAIRANASATGGLRGGNIQRSLAGFRSDLLGQSILSRMTQLGSVASGGVQTAANLGQFGQANADSIANLFGQRGSALAGGTIARGSSNLRGVQTAAQIGATAAGFF